MPIGDLLASITGEKSKPPPSPRTSLPAKRKADDDTKIPAAKTQRTASTGDRYPPSTARHGGDVNPPAPPKPIRDTAAISAKSNAATGPPKQTPDQKQRHRIGPGAVSTAASLSSSEASTTAPKATPKKGSFAEIMARAAKAQQSMGQVGKIQHKPLEKGSSKRERGEAKTDTVRGLKPSGRDSGRPGAPGVGAQRVGTSGSLAPRNGDLGSDRRQSPVGPGSKARLSGKKEPPAEVKKPKKAAVATTGYQGTARPPPGATGKGGSSSGASAGTSTARNGDIRRRLPFGLTGSRNRRTDDYDDMDDFIDDHEDELEETGYGQGRYRYASEEDESDMEAGLSDIDEEERAAELLGRREDREQEALEQRLKREKEERKRRLLQATAAKRR